MFEFLLIFFKPKWRDSLKKGKIWDDYVTPLVFFISGCFRQPEIWACGHLHRTEKSFIILLRLYLVIWELLSSVTISVRIFSAGGNASQLPFSVLHERRKFNCFGYFFSSKLSPSFISIDVAIQLSEFMGSWNLIAARWLCLNCFACTPTGWERAAGSREFLFICPLRYCWHAPLSFVVWKKERKNSAKGSR